MSGVERSEPEVHRLVDMVVEEVSLVDRAANKRRFLVVKRDKMAKDDADKDDEELEETEEESEADEEEEPAKKADSAALGIATSALELLTGAVERLSQASAEESEGLVSKLAEELRRLSEQLAQAAGAATEPEPSEQAKSLSETVTDVRALLGQVSELIASARAGAEGEPPPNPTVSKADSSGGAAAMAQALTQVNDSLARLSDTLKDQSTRIGRLEKSFGLPNSRPSERAQPRGTDEDVGWPLDLNKPRDRESVDKATSFHRP